MGTFRKELFDKLADAHDIKFDPDQPHNAPTRVQGITNGDILDLEKFKNRVFQILMLRAAQFLAKTMQEEPAANPRLVPEQRFAETSVKIVLSDFSIHSTSSARGIIPQAMSPDVFDDANILQLVAAFGSNVNLVCD